MGFNAQGENGMEGRAGLRDRPVSSFPKTRGGHATALGWVDDRGYLASAGASAAAGLPRLAQLYFRWNFSTRPVVSTNFILPVKNGWQAEQISTVMFCRVLRVGILLPQPQV